MSGREEIRTLVRLSRWWSPRILLAVGRVAGQAAERPAVLERHTFRPVGYCHFLNLRNETVTSARRTLNPLSNQNEAQNLVRTSISTLAISIFCFNLLVNEPERMNVSREHAQKGLHITR